MATTSTFLSTETSPARNSVGTQQTHQLLGGSTDVHTMPTGMGSHSVRRRTTPEAGLALEVLGHAIEYLADEYVHEADLLSFSFPGDSRVEAIQLLMVANRQVYYACPLMPSIPPWPSLLWWTTRISRDWSSIARYWRAKWVPVAEILPKRPILPERNES
ncbi:MAG TPA: hypothetical protein VK638_03030 [Edaphobacter sp.]|nr:hypothetical protein [Edaphobacter sp.]